MVMGKNGRSFEAGGETDPTPLTDEVKKKECGLRPHDRSENFYDARYQGGLKLQARTLAVLPHSLVGHSMTYDVPKILKLIRHLK
jgi:hypothetical protein